MDTRSIKRGFTRFVGEPLMTLALAAQVVDYNLKELEDWHARAMAQPREYVAAIDYSSHPLHTARTEHTFGFQMLTPGAAGPARPATQHPRRLLTPTMFDNSIND